MGPFWIIGIVLIVGTFFFALYAIFRLPKRFEEGDVEGFSTHTEEWAKKYEDPPPS